eukprot:2227879-Pyramimonas_sp.AAC.1
MGWVALSRSVRPARALMFGLVAFAVLGMSLAQTDTAPPTWDSRYPRITDIGLTSLSFTVQQSETGVVYYVIVPHNATAPSVAEVMRGTGSNGTGQVACGALTVKSHVPVVKSVEGVPACPDPIPAIPEVRGFQSLRIVCRVYCSM